MHTHTRACACTHTNTHRFDQYADAWDTSITLNVDGQEVRYFHAVDKHGVDRVWIDHPWFLSKASACCRFAPKSLLLPRGSFKQAHSGPCVDRPPLVPFQGTLQVDGSRKEALVILLLSLLDDWTVGGWLDHPLHFCSSVELCSFV